MIAGRGAAFLNLKQLDQRISMEFHEDIIHKEDRAPAKPAASRKKALAVLAVILVAVSAYAYFGIISPVVQKPDVEKPIHDGNITAEQVNWVVNEMGGYKLHASVNGEPAEIEIIAGDNVFTMTTKDGRTVTAQGRAANPDIRLVTSANAVAQIMNAKDVKAEILKLYTEGAVSIELLKDQATLALKGYKGIYDELQPQK